MPTSIAVKHEVSDQFLADVLTTAVESGGHALWYWEGFSALDVTRAILAHDGRSTDPVEVMVGGSGEHEHGTTLSGLSVYRLKFVVDHPQEQDEYTIDLEDVAQGIQWLLDGTVPISDRIKDYIANAVSEADAGDIDADAADCIIQAAAFKEYVFG